MKWVDTLFRVIEGVLNAINKHNKRKAVDDVADTISNGGVQHKSDQSFSGMARKSRSDRTE